MTFLSSNVNKKFKLTVSIKLRRQFIFVFITDDSSSVNGRTSEVLLPAWNIKKINETIIIEFDYDIVSKKTKFILPRANDISTRSMAEKINKLFIPSSSQHLWQCYYLELERNKNENDYNIVLPNEN